MVNLPELTQAASQSRSLRADGSSSALVPASVVGRVRNPLRRLCATGFLLLVSAFFSSAAVAAPFDVFFTGDEAPGFAGEVFGIGLDQATQARDLFGIPIIIGADIEGLGGVNSPPKLAVTLPDPASIVLNPDPPTSAQNRATSIWTAMNTSGTVLSGATYLIFTHTDPYEVDGVSIDYASQDVGITIDADEGWQIVQFSSAAGDFYYPAMLLDRVAPTPAEGSLAVGQQVTFSVNRVVNGPLIEVGAGTGVYALPDLEIGYANLPVPEPGTATLLGLGLMWAAGRRRVA